MAPILNLTNRTTREASSDATMHTGGDSSAMKGASGDGRHERGGGSRARAVQGAVGGERRAPQGMEGEEGLDLEQGRGKETTAGREGGSASGKIGDSGIAGSSGGGVETDGGRGSGGGDGARDGVNGAAAVKQQKAAAAAAAAARRSAPAAVVEAEHLQAFKGLQALGIIDGSVSPAAVCLRRDFARWLVACSNRLNRWAAGRLGGWKGHWWGGGGVTQCDSHVSEIMA